jgi:branched-chain amino acid aminotransferase
VKSVPDENQIYIDGDYYPRKDAHISVFDHGFLYGDGVFEGIRAYDGCVFRLDEHITRLYESAKSIDLQIPITTQGMRQAILNTLRKNKLTNAYIRVVITRGIGTLGLSPLTCHKPSVIIITDYLQPLFEGKNVKAIVASTRRNATTALNPRIKSLNYLNNVLARLEAIKADVDEAIMLNLNGTIAEGTGDNIFIIKQGEIVTPPATAGILMGITRKAVIDLARELKIPITEANISVHDLYNADEAFLTGTAAEIVPLTEVDSRLINDGNVGAITAQLIEQFKLLRKTGTPI